MYLLERGVRLTGTDAWSWDAPFSYTAKKVAETGDTSLIWEGHKAGRDIGYCHLEKLHNLEALPPHGFIDQLFPAQDPRRVRRLDAGGGHPRDAVNACGAAEDAEAHETRDAQERPQGWPAGRGVARPDARRRCGAVAPTLLDALERWSEVAPRSA